MNFILVSLTALSLGWSLCAHACGGCNKSSASETNKTPNTITTTSTVSAETQAAPSSRGALPIIRSVASTQNSARAFSSGFFESVGSAYPVPARERAWGSQRERGLREGGGSLRKPR